MKNKHSQHGFTLIETLIAIFLLTLTVGGLLELAAGGYFAVRYSRNQIVADNLLQESLEYIRNNRDDAVQSGTAWASWLATLNAGGCMSSTGCIVDPYATSNNFRKNPSAGEYITFFPSLGLYGYADSQYPSLGNPGASQTLTSYTRIIKVVPVAIPDGSTGSQQAVITSTLHWSNGSSSKTETQSILLTNWSLGS